MPEDIEIYIFPQQSSEGRKRDRRGMILYIIDDTPGVNTKQLFLIKGGRMSLRIGKGIGEESRCVFIYGNTKEG